MASANQKLRAPAGLSVLPVAAAIATMLYPAPATAQAEVQRIAPQNDGERALVESGVWLRHGYASDRAPVEWLDDLGRYRGVAADMLELVSQRTGLRFQKAENLDWSRSLFELQNGGIDLLPAASESAETQRFALFTPVYLDQPIAIVTREDFPYVGELRALSGNVVAVPRRYAIVDLLLGNYPSIRLRYEANLSDSLRSVSVGDADAVVDSLAISSRQISLLGLNNLKIAAITPHRLRLQMAVRRDRPELHALIVRGLQTITPEERQAIIDRHIPVRLDGGVDLGLVLRIAAVMAVVAAVGYLLFYLWNRSLKREVRRRELAEAELFRTNQALVIQRNELEKALSTIRRDISLARAVQQSVLPGSLEGFHNLRVRSFYRPWGEIGGDIFDVDEIADGRVHVFLADAMGHGVQAAFMTMVIQRELDRSKRENMPPDQALAAINRTMNRKYQHLPIYFPALAMWIDPAADTIEYASAGMGGHVLIPQEGAPQSILPTGPIMGIDPGLEFSLVRLHFRPGDLLALCTDGLVDAQNSDFQIFQDQSLVRALEESRGHSIDDRLALVRERFFEHLGELTPQDDVTLLLIERGPQSTAPV